MADAIDTSLSGELFNVPTATAVESPRDAHEPAPSEKNSIPDLEPPAQPPLPAYEGTPVECHDTASVAVSSNLEYKGDKNQCPIYPKAISVWRLSAELRAALAHIKLLVDIVLHQVPAPGRSPYV
ncbi:hypothetical protein EXIGLDRAFT_692530 [Exidia glandulosa HHB12029]|uniref:Uncharacterized protein n=1 Tax=Exidia glandulosa HHB12029 TaxID=1314781 RepID=A0A165HXM6_EXIGL|nr:hypothetical protein EXIGLDRAFT_692530 [Exidia glandulosa HHB12029]